jgi:hypothetical protein
MSNVVLTVVCSTYATNGDDSEFKVKTYRGKDEREVMNKIVKAHSYSFEGQGQMSAKELYENLIDYSDDGCDYIVGVYAGELVEYKPK